MFRFVRTSLLESQYYPPPNDFMERLLEQNELKQLEKEQTMQVRFLELLEGLPEEVQSALLENAYKTACLNKDATLEVNYLEGTQVNIYTDKFDFTTMKKTREPFTNVHSSKLNAWKDAYERLLK